MAYVGRASDLPQDRLDGIERDILTALTGKDPTLAANACLLVGLAISFRGGCTEDQVRTVVLGMIEGFKAPRSN